MLFATGVTRVGANLVSRHGTCSMACTAWLFAAWCCSLGTVVSYTRPQDNLLSMFQCAGTQSTCTAHMHTAVPTQLCMQPCSDEHPVTSVALEQHGM